MKLKDVRNSVKENADTPKTKIGAADVDRVLACFFDELVSLGPDEFSSVMTEGLRLARKRAG